MKSLLLAAALTSGPAVVIVGDTVVVASIHVRLKGVDAAEPGSDLGEAAKVIMHHRRADLPSDGEKTHRRDVSYCTTANGIDINQAIISQGAALACPRCDTRYVPFEQTAALAAQPRAAYSAPRR